MPVEPFKWNLKTISEETVAATEALFSFLPATGARDSLLLELRKTFMKHLGNETYFFVESVETVPCRQWLGSISDPAIVAVLGMAPLPGKILVHVDHVIAHHVIDKLLGGPGNVVPELRILTEAEIGVLQYLLTQMLSQIHALCGHDERVHFRFEQVLQRTENLVPLVPARDDGVVVTVRLGFADHVGFVRILFPNPLVAETMVTPLKIPTTRGERAYWRSRLEAFGGIKASVWAEAGMVMVHPDELKNLDVGDVVLLDESDIRLKGKKLDGAVRIRVGDGQRGAMAADVDADHDVLHCRIQSIETS